MESKIAEKNSLALNQNKPRKNRFIPKPKLKRILPEYVDFEKYIETNCENKITILKRESFQQIKHPTFIFFNHFRKYCAFHTKWLNIAHQLSLKYGEQIEFIAADIMDIDVLYTGRNPLSFCSRLIRPEDQTALVYAIDEMKRVIEHNYHTEEDLIQLCDKLLSGELLPSQPLPENNEAKLVKICVHHNYEELVLNSTKNIFLIINKERNQEVPTNYENLALALKDYNLDIVYMVAEKNYIPFEYQVNSYPTIIFIPHNDKKNFIYYEGLVTELEFVKKAIEQPKYLQTLQQEQLSKMQSKSKQVPDDFRLMYKKLPEFLRQTYGGTLELLDREVLEKSKKLIIIAFMNFQGKCLPKHVEWLNKLKQVAETSIFKFFIADFEDIDIVNSKWRAEDLINSSQGKPKIYAFDRLNHSYEFGNFDSISDLYYFADSIEHGDSYYSQVCPNDERLVKSWTADCFNNFLQYLKKPTFITFYSSADEKAEKLLNSLETVAQEVKELKVEVVKFDVKQNYVDLEYAHDNYPVHYFIPKNNKRDKRLYIDSDLDGDKIVEFIKKNVEENVC